MPEADNEEHVANTQWVLSYGQAAFAVAAVERPGADALEDATWSARRDPATGYGIGVFDLDPGTGRGDHTRLTVTYHHAVGADPDNPATGQPGAPNPHYTKFETVTLVRPRSDR
jgi:hypothetical protein